METSQIYRKYLTPLFYFQKQEIRRGNESEFKQVKTATNIMCDSNK